MPEIYFRHCFGFLAEMMHFAPSVSREAGTLPQVTWLGIESGMALVIHGKRVELGQFRKWYSSLLKDVQMQLDSRVQMDIKTLDWSEFEVVDDLTNIRDGYSFVSSPNTGLMKEHISACLDHWTCSLPKSSTAKARSISTNSRGHSVPKFKLFEHPVAA
jgi:hypothetical protein